MALVKKYCDVTFSSLSTINWAPPEIAFLNLAIFKLRGSFAFAEEDKCIDELKAIGFKIINPASG